MEKKIQTTNQPGFIHLINQGFSVTGCFQVPITSRICLFSLFQPMDCWKQIRLIHLHFETSWSHGFRICFPIKCPIFGASMGQQPWVFSGPEQLLGLGRAATSTGKPMALASSAPENWRGKITHISYILNPTDIVHHYCHCPRIYIHIYIHMYVCVHTMPHITGYNMPIICDILYPTYSNSGSPLAPKGKDDEQWQAAWVSRRSLQDKRLRTIIVLYRPIWNEWYDFIWHFRGCSSASGTSNSPRSSTQKSVERLTNWCAVRCCQRGGAARANTVRMWSEWRSDVTVGEYVKIISMEEFLGMISQCYHYYHNASQWYPHVYTFIICSCL